MSPNFFFPFFFFPFFFSFFFPSLQTTPPSYTVQAEARGYSSESQKSPPQAAHQTSRAKCDLSSHRASRCACWKVKGSPLVAEPRLRYVNQAESATMPEIPYLFWPSRLVASRAYHIGWLSTTSVAYAVRHNRRIAVLVASALPWLLTMMGVVDD
ncbi:hypothetical protein B0H67DRAFT_77854 [Lasiosphaeris hirsuta]|uniref:Uncharacterized protein n=1 Tax=Lasiosphaeris hirsuta TaxID=260670 RepID=A0AA40EAX7_9PEZI|nr:hypothetical protein B0H67DRAFT_77854 [Lasiosphaeris hirsuta]